MLDFDIRQYYIPAVTNAEHHSTLCQIAAECATLSAEGWTLANQLALPGGREVLFTFTRAADSYLSAVNKGGRPRKVDAGD